MRHVRPSLWIGVFGVMLAGACSGASSGPCDPPSRCAEAGLDASMSPDADLMSPADGSLGDASSMDAMTGLDAEVDATIDGAVEDATPDARLVLAAEIFSPLTGARVAEGDPLRLEGLVSGRPDIEGMVQLRWESSIDGMLHEEVASAGGMTRAEVTPTPGIHRITLTATHDDGEEVLAEVTGVAVCGWRTVGDFATPVVGWEAFGAAMRDARGWLELTGNVRDRRGGFFNIVNRISPGDVYLRFRISTGQCSTPGPCTSGTGADGFAMSIFGVADPPALRTLLASAYSGGGLAYGVAGRYGSFAGDGFHVEFDTWHNRFNGTTELHTDPTTQNHIAVTLDGDPGVHHAWAPVAGLEDNRWHQIEVQVTGDRVRVSYDGTDLLNQRIEGLSFQGGYIGFTGSTGYYTNYHRFDDLQVREGCI